MLHKFHLDPRRSLALTCLVVFSLLCICCEKETGSDAGDRPVKETHVINESKSDVVANGGDVSESNAVINNKTSELLGNINFETSQPTEDEAMAVPPRWKTIHITDGKGEQSCAVYIHSPEYTYRQKRTPSIIIYWDNQIVFDGRLPAYAKPPWGVPFWLMKINTNPGDHLIEIRHGDKAEKNKIQLEEGDERLFRLFDEVNSPDRIMWDVPKDVIFQ